LLGFPLGEMYGLIFYVILARGIRKSGIGTLMELERPTASKVHKKMNE